MGSPPAQGQMLWYVVFWGAASQGGASHRPGQTCSFLAVRLTAVAAGQAAAAVGTAVLLWVIMTVNSMYRSASNSHLRYSPEGECAAGPVSRFACISGRFGGFLCLALTLLPRHAVWVE